ncbi:MAG: xanthine dehydrogenase family protein molybdopterin-binding subunit [Vicinamibacterales bacterium]
METVVGTSVDRKEGRDKIAGTARFIDDVSFPGLLYARTIRSTIPAGTIERISFDFDPSEFAIVSARDIPGRNVVALIEDDQPCLADGSVRHQEEPILLIAHPDRARLWEAHVRIEYTPSTPVLDVRQAQTVFKRVEIAKGNLADGFAEADVVVDGEYRTGHQEQLYIEPNGVIAVPSDTGMTVYGSLQCPYYVHRALCVLLGLSPSHVRVVQTETGGGFGGKEDYPSMIAGHAALLARKSGRPVKLTYDRLEDLVATTKRHPSIVRHRTGVTRGGRITAMDVDVLLDGGAYTTLSPVVLSRGCIHATGPYRCPHVRVTGRVVMTNTPPNGAFRGFGAPQTQFAAEVQMDRVADALGLDPVEFRRRNVWKPGDLTATGQRLGEDCAALDVLETAASRTRFTQRRQTENRTGHGIGVSLFFHGAGFTGSGEVKLASKATLELNGHGVCIRVASTEIGQGTRTVLAQIVAETLGIAYESVMVHEADTAAVPDSGPTVASRTCMVVGGLLHRCALKMRDELRGLSPQAYFAAHGAWEVTEQYQPPLGLAWDDDTYRGDAYATYGYGCDVVELGVDPDTYEVALVNVTSVHEAGRIINPTLARGQVEGGTVQGLGMALYEHVAMSNGRMANGQLTNYIIPTAPDVPALDVVLMERPYAQGPYGAKGIGEMPIDGPAAAVVNALRHAGYDVRSVPATPEVIMESK